MIVQMILRGKGMRTVGKTKQCFSIVGLLMTFLVMLCSPASIQAQTSSDDKAKVLIITTGGTIASQSGKPMIDGASLVEAIPIIGDYASLDVKEAFRIGSSRMTPVQWLILAKEVNKQFKANPDLDGIVITHGTDTMEETAYFLNLTVKSNKPVVITGSMRSSDEISADGPANLVNAVRVAASKQAIGQGVLVVLNENISGARDVWKQDNRRADTFDSPSAGYLGAVDPDAIQFFQKSTRPHTVNSEFNIDNVNTLPEVVIMTDFTGINEDLVGALGTQKMDGLVIRTFAGARMSKGMSAGLAKLQDQNIPTVISSRVPSGRVINPPNYGFPAIFTNDQPDNKARILLMLGLTKTKDRQELQRIFNRY